MGQQSIRDSEAGVGFDAEKSSFQAMEFEQYKKVLDGRGGPMALISFDNRYLYMNERHAKFFGFASIEEAMKAMKEGGPSKFSPEKQHTGKLSEMAIRDNTIAAIKSKTGVYSFNWTHTKKSGSEKKVLILPSGKFENPMKKFAKMTSQQYDIFEAGPLSNPQFTGEGMAVVGGSISAASKKFLVLDTTGKKLMVFGKKGDKNAQGVIGIDAGTLIRGTEVPKCFELSGQFRSLFRIEGGTEAQSSDLRELLGKSQAAQDAAKPKVVEKKEEEVEGEEEPKKVVSGKMKVLIVLAHMRTDNSVNHVMAKSAKEHLEKNGCEVRLLDLYAMKFDPLPGPADFKKLQNPDFFDYQSEQKYAAENDGFSEQIKEHLDHALWADLMIWQFPLFWWSYPTILKGWIDKVFAYHVIYGGGKTLKAGIMMSCTSGGDYAAEFNEKFSFGAWGWYKFKQVKPFLAAGVLPFVDGKREEALFMQRRKELSAKLIAHLDEHVLGDEVNYANFKVPKMNAIVYNKYGGPEVMVKQEVLLPEPKEGEIRVKIHCTALNAADYKVRNGWMSAFVKIEKFPVCFGYDLSGTVEKVGKGVNNFKVGDEVSGFKQSWVPSIHSGTFCEFVCLPEGCCCVKPKEVSFEEAAAIPVGYCTAVQIINEKLTVKKADVLVTGASGGVGVFAVQILGKLRDCKNVIVAASARNHDYLKSLGATHCIDYKNQNIAEEVMKICPDGVDNIFDCATGTKEQLEAIDTCCKKTGKIMSISNFFYKQREVEFSTYSVKPIGKDIEEGLTHCVEGKLEIPVGGTWGFDEVQEAFKVMEGSHPPGKLVVNVIPPPPPRMKVLIVLAHMNTGKSANHAIARAAERHLKRNGCAVRFFDLYAEKFNPLPGVNDFNRIQNMSGFFDYQAEQKFAAEYDNFADDVKKQIDDVLWADLLIWQFPMFWFSYPTILKGWIDKVFAYHTIYGGGKTLKAGIMMSITSGGAYEDIEQKFSYGAWGWYKFKQVKPFLAGWVGPMIEGKKDVGPFNERKKDLAQKMIAHLDEHVLGDDVTYVNVPDPKMKAIVYHKYGGPEVMVKEEVDLPKPKEGEIRVKVYSTALNAADYKVRNGWMESFVKIEKFPVCFGYDLSGVVERVGKGVKNFKVGDEVSGFKQSWVPSIHSGTFCEFVCLPEACCCIKPKEVTWQEAAAVPVGYCTAVQIINEKLEGLHPHVLVTGASGGVGVFAVQILGKLRGCRSVIVAASARNHEFLKSLGATHCIDYKTQNVAEEVLKICPDGVDNIFDCATGTKEQLEAIDSCCKKTGKIMSISNFFYKQREVEFSTYSVKPIGENIAECLNHYVTGKIEIPIGGIYEFDEVQDAFKVMEGAHPPGKLVVDVIPTSMKACVYHKYGGPEVMVMQKVAIPEPKKGEVRVKLHCTALNAADYKVRNGWMSAFVKIEKFPVCFGYDVSGIVDKLGEGVQKLKIGHKVGGFKQSWVPSIHSGTFCEYVCLPEECCAIKPDSVSWEEAAAIPVGTLTANQIVNLKVTKEGMNVLIMGASGGVGVFTVQLAKLKGCKNIICAGSARNHEFLKSLGATHCIDYKTQDVSEEVKKICPDGVDVILDCATGTKEQLEKIDGCCNVSGSIISISNFFYQKRNVDFMTHSVQPIGKEIEEMFKLIVGEKIKIPIGGTYPFEKVQDAFKIMESEHPPGKLVVKIQE